MESRSRSLTQIFSDPDGGIRDVAQEWMVNVPEEESEFTAFLVGTRVEASWHDGRPMLSTELARDLPEYGSLNILPAHAGQRILVWYNPSSWLPRSVRQTIPQVITEHAWDGSLLKTHVLPHLPKPVRQESPVWKALPVLTPPPLARLYHWLGKE